MASWWLGEGEGVWNGNVLTSNHFPFVRNAFEYNTQRLLIHPKSKCAYCRRKQRVWDAVSGGFEFSQKMAMPDGDHYPLNN